ncbi:GGDEF domain-containing protein [Burkholderia sp. Bp8963]|uniref:GGDEF domain-containing protein n=1 Tax=Burkholderia sp. Bp8963 TaxID=2184547 RepID=UPI000F5971DD|nr:GGDEF domain-containing protein [Burkholderia sp. Bp8963]RQS71615.1 GGDEF domain-containing protein [Burkholderia sp. Bp8963]
MLDPVVAIATSALMSLILAALLVSLLRSGIPGVPDWLAANLLMVVALPLVLLRGRISDAVSVVVANQLMALATILFYVGCARFLRRRVRWPVMAAALVAISVALVYWRYAVDSIPMRVLATTLFSAAYCIAGALLVVRHRPAGRSAYPYWATATLALTFGVCQVARGLYFMTLSGASNVLMFASTWNVVLLTIGAAVMPTLSMTAMMMVHDMLLSDARDAADRDFLTGALSRKGFEAAALQLSDTALGRGIPISLLIVDLDHFKAINDTFGHAGGDTVLREFVRAARLQLTRSDVLGRIGGEEFAVLLADAAPADALRLAERLRHAVAGQPVATGAGPCAYSISGGIAGWRAGDTLDRVNARADAALYEAKRAGRNRICVHRERRDAKERLSAGNAAA